MNVDLVADVGNSRIKWGRCLGGAVAATASLPAADPTAWEERLREWGLIGSLSWAVGGVHPDSSNGLVRWLQRRGDAVRHLTRADPLPIQVLTEHPDRVGMDRLFNAVAAARRLSPGRPGVLVDAGSAVTVDWLDEVHAFRGGAIFPGVRLMARALHDYTALLPAVPVGPLIPPLPGRSTVPAMQAGVFWAVVGGVETIARRLGRLTAAPPHIFLTGGDAEWIEEALDRDDGPPWLAGFEKTLWPEQTLQGLLLSAEALPP